MKKKIILMKTSKEEKIMNYFYTVSYEKTFLLQLKTGSLLIKNRKNIEKFWDIHH